MAINLQCKLELQLDRKIFCGQVAILRLAQSGREDSRVAALRDGRREIVRRHAVLFDVGGPIDMEFAWEIAVDGAIAAACGMEGVRVDQAMVEEASDRAVAAFAADTYG